MLKWFRFKNGADGNDQVRFETKKNENPIKEQCFFFH